MLGVFPDRRTSAVWSRECRNLQRVMLAQLLLGSGTPCFLPPFPSSVSAMKADEAWRLRRKTELSKGERKERGGRASPGLSVAILSPVLLAAAIGP